LQSAAKLGLEGIVSKKLGSRYHSGRSENWTKAKTRAGQEVVLGGWKTTNGKFRSLMAGVHRDGHLAFVGSLARGSGRTRSGASCRRSRPRHQTKSLWRQGCAAQDPRRALAEAELVAEVEFAGWTDGGNIRQARSRDCARTSPPARWKRKDRP